MQASQPTSIQPAPAGAVPVPTPLPQIQQQQQMIQPQQQQAPVPAPANGTAMTTTAPGSQMPMQHTQYAPQPQHHVQGTTYQPQPPPPQQQQQQPQQIAMAPGTQPQQQQQHYQQPQQQQQQQQQLAPQPIAQAPGQPQQQHIQQQQYVQQQQPPQQPQPVYQQQQPVVQQQQQQQQQNFAAQGLNGGWQSDQDYNERRKMIAKIVHLLKQRKPNAPQDWLKKLPQMAKRLEESLYRSAKDFNEYNDASTLKSRLQQLAHSIGMKTKRFQQAQMARQQQQQQQPQQQQQQIPQQQQQAPPMAQIQYRPAPQQPPQPQPQQQQPIAPMQPQPVQPNQPMPQHQQSGQRIVNVAEINPIMNGQPAVQQQPPPPQQQQPQARPVQYQSQQPVPVQQVSVPAQPQNGVRPPNGVPPGGRQFSDRQQVLRHQQQRLLLLRHAAKCQHDDGKCPVTPHCAGMKRLWKHIAECKDQKCLVPHCVSSRYVLSHYHRCKDVRCPVCGPVREAIHRSHEKQKQMQALKHRHQQAVQQSQQQSGTVPQPIQPAPAVPNVQPVRYEPPNKRQRTSVASTPGQYPQQQQPGQPQPFQQRSSGGAAMPAQAAAAGQPYPYGQQPAGQARQRGSQVAAASGKPMIAAAPGVKFANGQVITPKFTGPKPQEDHTLINCFSVEQIEKHIASLNNGLQLSPQKLKTKCLEVLKVLQGHQHGWVFNSPVDPVELGLPDYFEVIKKPMDLGTIRKRLENNCYHSLEEFESHAHLTFDNAMLYNPEGSVVYNMANEMKAKFAQDFQNLKKQLNEEEDAKRRNGEACSLCGCEKLLFEPPIFYCNGANCPSKRIRRNAYYFVGGNNQYHWCQQCFNDLKPNQRIELGEVSIQKEQLLKKKNDELHEESWVQCDRCERWVHQICALFNTRQNKDQRSEFACPRCTIEERKKTGRLEATSQTPMAEDLQRTKLSEFLENHVRQKMNEHLEELASEKKDKDGITMEEAVKAVEMGGAITIRQVTSMDRKLEVRDRMKNRYAFKNYPDEFSFRCKCIVVFQNLDGVDVVLFGLYVYEHDEKNPAPNTRTVYVSYLDSVHYMRPRSMRTFIYHEILISYLDYVRRRGFSTAHIWACPPLKGDDYILYAKPEDQKTPKDDRLRQWYVDMLVECQRRGIVGKLTNMYDLYFSNKENDATIVPYMEGDYFPAEVENIIKELEDGQSAKKKGGKDGKKKKGDKKQKQKKKGGGRGGTRSSGIDEEALKASGIDFPGMDQKSLEEGGRDYVMAKLGETIQPMKESFLVAYLARKGANEADMVVPKAIEEYREKHNISTDWENPRQGIKSSDDKAPGNSEASGQNEEKADDQKKPSSSDPTPPPSSDLNVPSSNDAKQDEAKTGDETAPMDTSSGKDEENVEASTTAPEQSAPSSSDIKVEMSDEGAKKDESDSPAAEPAPKSEQEEKAEAVAKDASTETEKSVEAEKSNSPPEDADLTSKTDEGGSKTPEGGEGPASADAQLDKESKSAEKVDGDTDENRSKQEQEDTVMTNADDDQEKADDSESKTNTTDESKENSDAKADDDVEMKDADHTEAKEAVVKSEGKAESEEKPESTDSTKASSSEQKALPEEQEASKEGEEKKADAVDEKETAMDVDPPADVKSKDTSTEPAPKSSEEELGDSKTTSTSQEQKDNESTTGDASGDKPVQADGDKPAESTAALSDSNAVPGQGPTSSASKADSSDSTTPPQEVASASVPDKTDSAAPASSEEAVKPKLSDEQRSGKFAAMAKKRPAPDDTSESTDAAKDKKQESEETKEAEKESKPPPDVYVTDSKGRRVKVIDDDAEEMDCEFLNNRQAFLNLCQGNHYQFDQLRRAKHSSMMVLWHLHNRDAPKFVSQCGTCSREILSGYRFHCPTCADFDQCQDCYNNPNTIRHPHPLKPIPVTGQAQELTAEQRKERQRSIQLHMTLLQHAATCNNPKCPSANCAKMKGLLKHGTQCKIKAAGGCNVCKRIWALLQIHARQCKQQQCPVPNCMAIRERFRQLKKQQQAMDDRRRQEMNRAYRGGR